MKKQNISIVFIVCTILSLFSGCDKEKGETLKVPAYAVPSLYERTTIPENEPEPPRKKEELKNLASETDEYGKTISKWPSIELSGDPEEVVEIGQDCFYEDDRFFLFFQKGVSIRGDVAVHMERIMRELEEELHLSFDRDPVNSEINWRFLYFHNAFSDVNRDLSKVNILILNTPENDEIEWAAENVAVLFDKDVFSPQTDLSVAYHELAHVLQLRQSNFLGTVLTEGIATYAEYKLSVKENRPARSCATYVRDERNLSLYDESRFYDDPVAAFIEDSEITGFHEDKPYQCGIRFVTFLVETYGEDVLDKICRISLRFEYDETYTDMIMRVIKDATSDDVFERFGRWLPDGWKRYGEEYARYMSQFEPRNQEDSSQACA